MMKILLFLVMLTSITLAGYVDYPQVVVVDSEHRAIEGANVWAVYQRDQLRGDIQTLPVMTDVDGHAELRVTNLEPYEQYIDYDYIVYVSYMGHENQKTITHKDVVSDPLVSFTLPSIHNVGVHVYDAFQGPLEAEVTVLDITRSCSEYGNVYFSLPTGSYDVSVYYNGYLEVVPIDVYDADVTTEVVLTSYKFNVTLVDDFGNLLDGEVQVADQLVQTVNGTASFDLIVSSDSIIYSTVNGVTKQQSINLAGDNTFIIVYDYSVPQFEDISFSINKGSWDVTVIVSDPGSYGSGIDSESVQFKYSLFRETREIKRDIILEKQSDKLYYASFVGEEDGTVIEYQVIVNDNEGNIVIEEGSLIIKTGATSDSKSDVEPDTDNNADEDNEGEIIFGLGMVEVILIVVGISALLIVGFIMINKMTKVNEN